MKNFRILLGTAIIAVGTFFHIQKIVTIGTKVDLGSVQTHYHYQTH